MTSQRRGSLSQDHPNMCELRIVLLGKNLSENCKVRNLILEIDMCENEEPSALLRHNLIISGMVENRHVKVINSLHLLNPDISDHQIKQIVRECVNHSDPGPHVFILVLQYNDFTEDDIRRVKHVLKQFSEEAIKRTIVLTTDKETKRSMISSIISHTEQLIGGSTTVQFSTIHQFIKDCGGGHLQLDERKTELQTNLFKWVDEILKGNQEDYLTSDIFRNFKGMFVDEEPINSEDENTSSHHNAYGKSKETQKRGSEEGSLFSNFSGKQKLNLVLCGSNGSLKVSVSKLLRGKKMKPSRKLTSSGECVKKGEDSWSSYQSGGSSSSQSALRGGSEASDSPLCLSL
ncbi:GTPase IMAP family member 9-like [Pseudorasbora parva]|uniref:GTPase IMAP family member 9-like n=1 Tax=Pseudorasbora parva TaxID=51549 RepID=UPI00351DC8E0